MQIVGSKDALERGDEELADVEDAGHESVGLARVEQEQDARVRGARSLDPK
jgi:hypothetical protein